MSEHLTRNILIYTKSLLLEQLLKQHLPPYYVLHTLEKGENLTTKLQAKTYDGLLINIQRAEPDLTQLTEIVTEYSGRIPLLVLSFQAEAASFSLLPAIKLLLKPHHLHRTLRAVESLFQSSDILRLNERCTLSPANRSVTLGLTPVSLTEKEVALLKYLYEGGEKVISKAELLQHIWGYGEHTDTHTVETHIYRLRQKIGEGENLIITEENGYRIAR